MFKYSIRLKMSEFDWNPTLESMQKDYKELVEIVKSGNRHIKAAYGLDKNGRIIKIAVVCDPKENDMAKNFLDGDGVKISEPLHDANVSRLMEDIKKIINRAGKIEGSKEMKNADKMMESNTAAVALENKEEVSEITSVEMKKSEADEAVTVEEKSETVENPSEVEKREIKGDLSLATDLMVDCTPVASTRVVVENKSTSVDIEKIIPVVNDAAEPEGESQPEIAIESDEDTWGNLKRYGGIKISDSSAQLAVGKIYKDTIIVELLTDELDGGRVYRIIEIHNGQKRGEYSKKCRFEPADLKDSSRRLEKHIGNMLDDFSDSINDVIAGLKIIETNRLLKITSSTKKINASVATTEAIIERLKDFMLANPLDDRLFSVEIAGELHVGIVGRGTNTVYKNFRRLMEEIAPENSAKSIKDEMRNKNILRVDRNDNCFDCQHSVPVEKRIDKIGPIRGDKMISLDLGKAFALSFYKAREDAMGKSASNESKKSQTAHGEKIA